ncbi:MAG: phenylalanine--tRNA ligase subunit beta [Methylococcales bacterium]
MRFSEAWLREFADPAIETGLLVEQLTMAGLEVDGIESAAPSFKEVVVGKVDNIKPHPKADRLQVCQVAVGQNEPLQIVCGASNVRVGMKVPVALPGAELPGGKIIKKSELRGIVSFGMLCSEKELGLAESADGLMVLPANVPEGTDIRAYFDLDDAVIELDLTPNRADCLSVEGIAREVAALNKIPWKKPTVETVQIRHSEVLSVQVDNPSSCPRYLGRLITNVNPRADTPSWMKERLRRSGLRNLGPLVDVTNYVLLELGQPLHAFDRDKIEGGIRVRNGHPGEKLLLLNDQEVELDDDTLVIAGNTRALALAGIMGGSDSAVTENTKDIFLECAFFTPSIIMGKARQYGLHTDSSHRFERGVDPELQERALERATELIIAICGGKAGSCTSCCQSSAVPQQKSIRLRQTQLNKILGLELDSSAIQEMLQRLNMYVEVDSQDGWVVKPPSFRFDIAIEADLIEEIARIHGYNNLPLAKATMGTELTKDSESILDSEHIKDLLVHRDYQEAITYSFVDQILQNKLDPETLSIKLKNPISSDLAVMRTTLWGGLIQAAQRNYNRQQDRIRLFETGLRFENSNSRIVQKKVLSGLAFGRVEEEQWGTTTRDVDFFDIKSDIEAILELTGQTFKFAPTKHPALHPGQTAAISVGKSRMGIMGMLHPTLEESFGFDSSVFLFELDANSLLRKSMPAFKPLSKFPRVQRDLAIIVDDKVAVGELMASIYAVAPEIIKYVTIFDVYRGEGVELSKKSVGFSLVFEEPTRTLKDAEIDSVVSDILTSLFDMFNARLRD